MERDELLLVTVQEPVMMPPVESAGFAPGALRIYVDMQKIIRQEALHTQKKYASECDKRGIRYRSLLVAGDPKDALCELAKDEKVDMLVMGRRGLSKLDRLLIGSVSEYCVQNAPCSVMTVRLPTSLP